MGGIITVVVRDTKKKTYSFKKSTGFVDLYIHDFQILDEEFLHQFLIEHKITKDFATLNDHEDYQNSKSLQVPNEYGIILVDLVTKTILSANNYSGFGVSGIIPLKMGYQTLALQGQFIKSKEIDENQNEITKIIDVLETPINNFTGLKELYLLKKAMDIGAEIYLDNEKINKKNENIYTLLANLYGHNLMELSEKDMAEKIMESYKNKEETNFNDMQNIRIKIPGWKIVTSDKSFEVVNKIYQFMRKNDFHLSQEEEDLWKESLMELKNSKD